MINKGQADQLASYEAGGSINPMVQPTDVMVATRLRQRGYVTVEVMPGRVEWQVALTDEGRKELEAWRREAGLL